MLILQSSKPSLPVAGEVFMSFTPTVSSGEEHKPAKLEGMEDQYGCINVTFAADFHGAGSYRSSSLFQSHKIETPCL